MLETSYLASDRFEVRSDLFAKSKQLFSTMLAPIQTWRWRKFLRSQPLLAKISESSPSLQTRIYRPYLTSHLSISQRVDLLITHYRLAVNAGLGNSIKRMSSQPLLISDFSGKSGTRYQLTLSAIDPQHDDGEFVLRLKTGNDCIYTAAFSLVEQQRTMQLKLGGLHGLLATDNILRIKNITRDFFGWRPRNLMVSAVSEIGRGIGCTNLILIGNQHRLRSSDKRVCKKSSNYHHIWQEMNAIVREDGDFELHCKRSEMAPADIRGSSSTTIPALSTREAFSRIVISGIGKWISHEIGHS